MKKRANEGETGKGGGDRTEAEAQGGGKMTRHGVEKKGGYYRSRERIGREQKVSCRVLPKQERCEGCRRGEMESRKNERYC